MTEEIENIPRTMDDDVAGVAVVEAVAKVEPAKAGRPRKTSKKMGKPAGKKSAYTFFVQAEKAVWQEAHPDEKIVFGNFMKECGAKWKTLNDDDKAPFVEKATADASRYASEMEHYVPEHGAKKRKIKDPNAPKRPQTAFFLYAADFRQTVRDGLPEGSTVGEVAKELGRRWGELGDDEKAKYQEQAEKNKAQYEKDMEAYNNGLYDKRARVNGGSDGSDDY